MKEGRILYLTVIVILFAILFFLFSNGYIVFPPIQPTPLPTQTIPPSPTVPSPTPTFVPSTPFPNPFIPSVPEDGGSELRTVVYEGGNFTEIAGVLQKYEWITGKVDYSRATALYLYDRAWVATTYTENYVHDLNLEKEFLYSGLVATIYMTSDADDGFCGIRMNAHSKSDYIDILLYRNGMLKSEVAVDGKIIHSDEGLLYVVPVETDGTKPFATVYLFYDEPGGLTVIADYLILGAQTDKSHRIEIDNQRLALEPVQGPVALRAGTNEGQTTYCAYADFYQYPIRH